MSKTRPSDKATLDRIARGLRLVTAPLPHLAGLAASVRVQLDERVPTMGVFASGRMLANPAFVARLKDNELIFVLAHELLHLALRTHARAKGSGQLEINYAHDYIINDILRVELGFATVPAGGLDMPGAREKSAEQIVLEMRRNADRMASKSRVFEGEQVTLRRALGPGDTGTERQEAGDVLDEATERELFPDAADEQAEQVKAMGEAAAKALALAKAMGAMKGKGGAADAADAQVVSALRGLYRTPWELALQRWMESVAPGERTFTRPSRRGGAVGRADIVLPGRRRESWMLNVVLDTSGSMAEEIPKVLGAIADFCDTVAVDQIRVVQCDTAVTSDELVSPSELADYRVSGYGGSDLTPAMLTLAEDANVTACLIVTDGDIDYPAEEMPYGVLWVLPAHAGAHFHPPYGHVVAMQRSAQP